MSQLPSLQDYMVDNFLVLGKTSTEEAQSTVAKANAVLAVIENQEGVPSTIVGPQGAGIMITCESTTPIQALFEMPEILEMLTEGTPGIVVMDNQQPIGVVPTTALAVYLQNEYTLETGTLDTLGDGVLYGTPTGIELVIECATCRFVNHVRRRIVQGETMCQNIQNTPHLLKIAWE